MRSFDKLQEARFHLRLLNEYKNEIDENTPKSIHRFRFAFNALVIAARSVTFVLQKDLRSIYGDKFNTWYEIKQKELSTYKSFVEIRNVVQKEGNKVLFSENILEDSEGNEWTIVWDHSENNIDSLISMSVKFSPSNELGKHIPAETPKREIDAWVQEATTERMNELKQRNVLASAKVINSKIRIFEESEAITRSRLIEMIKEYLDSLESLLSEANVEFPDTQPAS